MPMYEYKCADCGAEFEELVSLSDTQSPPCPDCSSVNTEKRMSVFGSIGGGSAGSSCGGSGFS